MTTQISISADLPDDGPPPLCDNCFRLPETPRGSFHSIGGLKYYSTVPTNGIIPPELTDRAMLVFPDIFGFSLKNPMILADEYAERLQITVYVPDTMKGHDVPLSVLKPTLRDTADQPKVPIGLSTWISVGLAALPLAPGLYLNIREGVVVPRLKKFIEELKTEKKITKIGCVGYCLGGMHSIWMSNIPGLLHCAVVAHPGPVKNAAQEGALIQNTCPTSWIWAEEDDFVDEKRIAAIEAALVKKEGYQYEMKKYKNCVHGFASRPNDKVGKQFREALDQTTNWIKKWVVEA